MSYFDNIRTFLRVYELGSMSAAARDQRISPAVASARSDAAKARADLTRMDVRRTRQQAQRVTSPIAGNLHAWKVADGDTVQEGDVIAVMEAMKMEMQVTAHRAGRVALVAAAGTAQALGAVIARIA